MRETLADWRPAVDEAIADLVPREIDTDYLESFFGTPTYEYDPTGIQRALATPLWDLLDRGGKRWRAVLFLVFIEEFGEDPAEYLPYACIPEILHNGTIIVDDVEDGATIRRGEPALHRVYGRDIALNAGNAMYFLPLKILTQDPAGLPADRRLAAYEMLMHELNRTHLGRGWTSAGTTNARFESPPTSTSRCVRARPAVSAGSWPASPRSSPISTRRRAGRRRVRGTDRGRLPDRRRHPGHRALARPGRRVRQGVRQRHPRGQDDAHGHPRDPGERT